MRLKQRSQADSKEWPLMRIVTRRTRSQPLRLQPFLKAKRAATRRIARKIATRRRMLLRLKKLVQLRLNKTLS